MVKTNVLIDYMGELQKIESLIDHATELKYAGLDVDDAITRLMDRVISLTMETKTVLMECEVK